MRATPSRAAAWPRCPAPWILAILVLPAWLAGCSSVSVHVDLDPDADFSAYQTYGWKKDWRPARVPPGHRTETLLDQRVIAAVDAELAARGLRDVGRSHPDLLVTYHTVVQDKISVSEHHGPRGAVRSVDVHHYKQGTLVVDFIDARMNQVVWRGVATSVVGNDFGHDERKVASVIAKIMREFPTAAMVD